MTDARAPAYVAGVIALLVLANVLNYADRMVLAILLPSIKADIELSDAQLGLLMGGVFAVFFALAAVPLSRLADRGRRRAFLATAVGVWSLATAALGLAQSFVQMLLARTVLGVGEAVCTPCSHSLISEHVPPARQPSAFGMHSTGAVIGIALATIVGGALAQTIGWRATLLAFAAPGLALALLIWFVLRDSPAAATGPAAPDVRLGGVVDVLRASPTYRYVLVAVCLGMLVEFGLSQWLPSHYVRRFELPLSEVGFSYGLVVALGGIPGSLLGGFLVDRLLRRDRRWLMWMPAAAYAVAVPIGLCMLLARDLTTALTLNCVYVFLVYATNGAFWAACFEGIAATMRATTSAITLLVTGVTGLAAGPVLVGVISDAVSERGEAASLTYSLVSVQCLGFAVTAVLLAAAAAHQRAARAPAVAPLAGTGERRAS